MKTGATGVLVDRLPPGRQCVESDHHLRTLAVYLAAIEQAQAMDRSDVRRHTAEEFETERSVDQGSLSGIQAPRVSLAAEVT
ncbi:MAG: hypothetical protein ACYC6N_24440 [Pirellulaceae bacterium]